MIYSSKIKYMKIFLFPTLFLLSLFFIIFLNIDTNEEFIDYNNIEKITTKIKKERTQKKLSINFIINKTEAIFSDDIIYFYLDSIYQNNAIKLDFEISDKNNLKFIVCDNYYQKNHKVLIDFEKNFKILFYNDKYYYEYELNFTNIPIINIKSNADVNSDIYVKGTIDIYEKNMINDGVNIKLHGGTSRSYKKKSYKIKLDHSSSILDLNNGDEFILDAAYADPSLIRNKLTTDIWNLISKNRSYYVKDYKSNFIVIFINNNYQGIYIIKEHIDKNSLNINKNGMIIKGIQYAKTIYDVESISNTNITYGGWELKYPKNIQNYDYYWKLFIEKLSPYYNNTITDEILYNTFDMDNLIDYRILLLFSHAIDNYSTKNTYLSIQDINNEDSKWIYTPWDLDQTYGRVWDQKGETYINNYPNNYLDTRKNFMPNPNTPKYNKNLKQRYLYLRKNILSIKNLYSMINSYYNELSLGEFDNNSKRWNEYNLKNEIDYIKIWIKNRLEILDKYIGDYNA